MATEQKNEDSVFEINIIYSGKYPKPNKQFVKSLLLAFKVSFG
jgi:hypothetical protein